MVSIYSGLKQNENVIDGNNVPHINLAIGIDTLKSTPSLNAVSKTSLLDQNLGAGFSLSDLIGQAKNNFKISGVTFFSKKGFWVKEEHEARVQSEEETSQSDVPVSRFVSKRNFRLTKKCSQDSTERGFGTYSRIMDHGSDYVMKSLGATTQSTLQNLVNTGKLNWYREFESPGSDSTVYTPFIQNMVMSNICVVTTMLIAKSVQISFEAQKALDSSNLRVRPMNKTCKLNSLKITTLDLLSMSASTILATAKQNDSQKTIHFFVPKGLERLYARLIHLMVTYKSPIYISDLTNENQLSLTNNSYSSSIAFKNINIFTHDPIIMNSELSQLNNNWFSNQVEFNEVAELFLKLVPHRYSARAADQLIFGDQVVLQSENIFRRKGLADSKKGLNLKVPLTQYPVYIGLVNPAEAQSYGYHPNILNFNDLINAQLVKWLNVETLLTIFAWDIMKNSFNQQSFMNPEPVDVTTSYETNVVSLLKGTYSADEIYNIIYNTDHCTFFFYFCGDLFKNLFNIFYLNPYSCKNGNALVAKLPITLSSAKFALETDNFPYPRLFGDGYTLDLTKNSSNVFTSSNASADIVQNLIGNNIVTQTVASEISISDYHFTTFLNNLQNKYFSSNKNWIYVAASFVGSVLNLTVEEVTTNLNSIETIQPFNLSNWNSRIVAITNDNFTNEVKLVTRAVKSYFGHNFTNVINSVSYWTRSTSSAKTLCELLIQLHDLCIGKDPTYTVDSNSKTKVMYILSDIIDEEDIFKYINEFKTNYGITLAVINRPSAPNSGGGGFGPGGDSDDDQNDGNDGGNLGNLDEFLKNIQPVGLVEGGSNITDVDNKTKSDKDLVEVTLQPAKISYLNTQEKKLMGVITKFAYRSQICFNEMGIDNPFKLPSNMFRSDTGAGMCVYETIEHILIEIKNTNKWSDIQFNKKMSLLKSIFMKYKFLDDSKAQSIIECLGIRSFYVKHDMYKGITNTVKVCGNDKIPQFIIMRDINSNHVFSLNKEANDWLNIYIQSIYLPPNLAPINIDRYWQKVLCTCRDMEVEINKAALVVYTQHKR